jgi:NAD(P)-dependent dehydrogenase (short-subunit alcohol dehydrogenase family)
MITIYGCSTRRWVSASLAPLQSLTQTQRQRDTPFRPKLFCEFRADTNPIRRAFPDMRVAAIAAHMGDLDDVKGLVEQTVSVFGGIDIVVNNAATALIQQFGEITPEAWHKSLSVNVTGPLFLVQQALPHLQKSDHAAVLNLISPAAFMFAGFMPLYSASKSALLALTRSIASAFAPRGIRVNALAPGPVNTDMVRKNTPEFIEGMARGTLLGRIAEPDEMVGPALLLTSDAGSYITGQVLLADGGTVPR